MTEATWAKILLLFDENHERIQGMEPAPVVRSVKFWRESQHRTIGHLTACQAAWLPIMRALREGSAKAVVPIRPDPLFTKLGFGALPWDALVTRFNADRNEWHEILGQIDVTSQTQLPTRTHSAQSLTKRMVEHEKRHLDDLLQR